MEIPESVSDEDCSRHGAYMRTQLLQYGKKKCFHTIRFSEEFDVDTCVG